MNSPAALIPRWSFFIYKLMKRVFLYALGLFSAFSRPVWAEVEIAFTPSKDCEHKIVELINKSKKYIDVAVYSINNQQIVEALYNAKQQNVAIRILTDRRQASGKYSKVMEMHEKGLNVRVHTKNKYEHNKFAIFDGKAASTGSYNWTNAASDKNSENCLFLLKEPDNIKVYQDRFEELWRLNSQDKSEQWFAKQKIKNKVDK